MAVTLLGGALLPGGALLLGGALATGSGCSRPTDRQPFPGTCTPLVVVSSVPADGAQGVPTDASVSLTFSDFPDPATVRLDTVVLSSGIETRLGGLQVDLITRSIGFQVRNLLAPNLTYLITVLSGVESLTGCFAKADQRSFRTGSGPSDPPIPLPPVPAFSDILGIFANRCGGATCHRPSPGDDSCLAYPAQGLSLCDRDAWAALVNADATELAGMKRVLPGDASRSYLMRKIVPGPGDGPVASTPGHRDPPDAPLDAATQRVISDWINGGAGP